MRKAERLFQLLNILRSRRTVITGQELADLLEVSPRTIYRDMQALSLSKIPIESEAGVGYRIKPGFNLPPIMFQEDELEALLLGVKMVQGWSDQQLGDAASRAFDKIKAILPDSLHSRHDKQANWLVVPKFKQINDVDINEKLKKAIKTNQQVTIGYKSLDNRQTERGIWPLGLVYWGKVWTLVAWCLLRQDYRVFRLDKITRLTSTEHTFETSNCLSLQHYIALQEAQHCEK
ncbi:YafY family transcriptional regulator [Paraglaciecola aquimarina]|uniref:YafY family transcriptional regulator n=1 Tax=Paraglaciecola algarum TaxID=3050085 RepID=A0ABS9DBR2_9ALTE|nr:YafY family protein [Paraglaciecola sp. G1-23]MCF2950275.1 YafY family transcriptional regulator [Paraglaciecola sp. G1-23]